MANNWQLGMIAGLDGTQSRNQLNSDIKGLARNLDKLKLYAEIDKNQVTQLQHQLKNLQVQLNNVTVSDAVINGLVAKINAGLQNVNIGNINIGNVNAQAQQVGNNIGQQINQGISSAIQKGDFQKEFTFSADKINKVAKDAQAHFKDLYGGVVTVTEQMEKLENGASLKGFTVNIKNAKGEVESLRYALKDIEGKTGKSFQYVGGSINDVGAVKQFEQLSKVITDYQTKLDDLKTKYSNANVNYSGFEKVFNDFKQGIGAVNDLKLAFNQLQNSAKLGVQSLKSQSSSFDPIQQTLNNMRDLPSRLQALQADMGGLKDKTAMADISIKDLTSEYQKLQSVMTNNGGKVPLADNWTESYRNLMSTLTSAENQVKALKKAEASDNSQITKQANYYSTILSNYRQIYSLKQKLLTAGKEETNVIKEQIRSLSASNASINKQLGTQGLKSKDWESEVSSLKEQLRYSYMISEAKQKDITNTKKQSDAQKQSTQMTKELATAYQKLGNLKVQKSSMDTSKDTEKITQLTQEIQKASQEYSNLYNTFRKRKNFDSSSWKETKSAIDSATKSQIEYNNAKAKDVFNSAKNNEISNLATLKTKWQEQGVLVGEFKTKVEQLENSLASVGSKGELNNLKTQMESLKAQASQIADVNKIQLQLDTGAYQSKVDSLVARTNQWVDANGNARISTESLKAALDNLSVAHNNLNSSGGNTVANQQALIAAEEALNVEVKKVQSSVTSMNATMAKSTAVDALRQKVQMFYDTNSKAHWRWGKDLKSIMTQLASGAEVPITKMRQLEQEFIRIQNSARQAGKLGLSFFDTIKQGISKFSYWTSSTFLVMKTIQSIKSAVSTVKELDTALVDLKKTTTMTAKELEDFYYASNETAKKMGVTTQAIIEQASAWSRLGYSSQEAATKMAEYSSMFATISPGMDLDSATDGLVSVMKAFKIGAEDVDNVVDGIMSKINIIGNTQALNNSDIVDFLTRSSSAMAEANNSLEETIALGTAATEITRDAASVGNMLKTVSMRIRGYDEETESYSEELENLSGTIANLTKTASTPGGVSLFADASKTTYKSTYQILKDISEIYDELDDKTQAELLEALAGKRQGQAVAAIINNFENAEKSMESMANSAGNAEAEMAVAIDSIAYKSNTLSEIGTGISQNLFGREDMKAVLDTINSLGEGIQWLTDKLGLFGTIAMGGGLFAGIKNIGQVKMVTC